MFVYNVCRVCLRLFHQILLCPHDSCVVGCCLFGWLACCLFVCLFCFCFHHFLFSFLLLLFRLTVFHSFLNYCFGVMCCCTAMHSSLFRAVTLLYAQNYKPIKGMLKSGPKGHRKRPTDTHVHAHAPYGIVTRPLSARI